MQREEEASLLAAVQTISTAAAEDAAGAEERLKVVAAHEQCSSLTYAPFQPQPVSASYNRAGLTGTMSLCRPWSLHLK